MEKYLKRESGGQGVEQNCNIYSGEKLIGVTSEIFEDSAIFPFFLAWGSIFTPHARKNGKITESSNISDVTPINFSPVKPRIY